MSAKKTTLDTDYSRQSKQFAQEYKQLPVKRKKLKQLQAQWVILDQKSMSTMSDREISDFYRLRGEITELIKEIENIEGLTKMTDFYLNTGELLVNYYDNLNQDKQ